MSEIKKKYWLEASQAALLVVDVQDKLVGAMDQQLYQQLLQNVPLLIAGFKALGLPMIATEQYSKGLGHTIAELQSATEQCCIEKLTFSCCGDDGFADALKKTQARQIVVVGMETHVCVLQTVIDLLDQGYGVHLVRDAVSSRFAGDYANAIALAAAAGAVITTTETALFQLVKVAGNDDFKAISKLVRQRTQ
ncbi:isochorismatase family protein [Pelovirga terrestris]|uniref:Isochorismatase family protein n=1 Tax=Pelovirga terrestris TaxID=2771352 RepID=A0A8J6QMG0_9BACT|nr:isochorismatase family protein [Pelovirga terrestris]MBD1400042.1 isochorismatase family protein [Pelovirga terrestris]